MAEKYNGWKNYETWLVGLWLDNEEGSYSHWDDRAREIYIDSAATAYSTRKEVASSDLAQEIQESVEEANPLPQSGLYTDMLNAAMGEVDWYEIADHYLDAVIEEVEADEKAEEQWDKDNITAKE
jgi:hypothetical protein